MRRFQELPSSAGWPSLTRTTHPLRQCNYAPISLVLDHPFSLDRADPLLDWPRYALHSTPYVLAAFPTSSLWHPAPQLSPSSVSSLQFMLRRQHASSNISRAAFSNPNLCLAFAISELDVGTAKTIAPSPYPKHRCSAHASTVAAFHGWPE